MAIYTNNKPLVLDPLVETNIMCDMNTEVDLYSNLIVCESMYRDTVTSIYQNVFPGIKYNDTDILHESIQPIHLAVVNFFTSYGNQATIYFNKAMATTHTLYSKLSNLVDNVHKRSELITNYPIHIQSIPKFTYDESVPDFIPFDNCIKNIENEYSMFMNGDESTINTYINNQFGGKKKAFKKSVYCNIHEPGADMYKQTKNIFKNNNIPVDVRIDKTYFDYQRTYIKTIIPNHIKDIKKNIALFERSMHMLTVSLEKYQSSTIKEIIGIDVADSNAHRINRFLRFQLDKFVFIVSSYYNTIMGKIDIVNDEIKFSIDMYTSVMTSMTESVNTAYNYCANVVNELYKFEVNDTYNTIYDIENEASYILNCMESNIILEAKNNTNKESIFKRLIDIITNIFNKFISKAKDLIDKATWNDKLLNKLDDINYNEINITCLELWNQNASPEKVIGKIQNMVNTFKRVTVDTPNNNVSVDDIIKNENAFREFNNESEGYRSAMKTIFTTGGMNNYVEKKYSGSKAKEVALHAKEYILGYEDVVNKLENIKNSITSEYKRAQNQLKTIKESTLPFITIENTTINNTDLVLCSNYALLYEETKTTDDNNKSSDSEPKATNVKVENNNPNNNDENLEKGNKEHINYVTCKQNMAKIILDAVSIAMTVFESKLVAYQKIVRAILNPKKENKPNTNNKQSDSKSNKKEPEKKETVLKRMGNAIKDKVSNKK